MFVLTGCEHNEPSIDPSNKVVGVFSVSATKRVAFSPGNLHYKKSTNTWSFASEQYNFYGTNNVTSGSVYSDSEDGYYIYGSSLANSIDLFSWSTNSTNFGVGAYSSSSYYGSFVDWGSLRIGNEAPKKWRTLTYDEWYYLLASRPNAVLLCGVAQVDNVNGLVLLPDNWTRPAGVSFKPGFRKEKGVDEYQAHQKFTVEQWSELEAAGAIFLPAAGYRDAVNIYDVAGSGYYWSSTDPSNNSNAAGYFYFSADRANMSARHRSYAHSVRLVRDL